MIAKEIKIKKGLDINLVGEAEKVYASLKIDNNNQIYVVKPTDFHSLIPKLTVKVGDRVEAGSPIFHDKSNDSIVFCSPVSGTIFDIVRGKKRRILTVEIQSEKDISYKKFPIFTKDTTNREHIIERMLSGGVWPFVRQKPYDIIANPNDIPKSIFISTFNSAPLSIDYDFAIYGMGDLFQKGLDYITRLTKGKTHLNIDANTGSSKLFSSMKGVVVNHFTGPHPAGNVGVQIHHIDPINKGDVVWYLNPQDVITIGRLFSEGIYDISRIVALSGDQVSKPRYHRTIAGAPIKHLLQEGLKSGENRIITGDILTGNKINLDGNLGFYDTTVTVIGEGKEQQFFGWLLPGINKFSASRTFFSWLNANKKYKVNSNMNGEERAYVVTGSYEKVLPMDIYPLQLIKSIMIEDIEQMENLGIYEVSPEDFALCEFVCTSKIEVQAIIRHGLDLIRKENS